MRESGPGGPVNHLVLDENDIKVSAAERGQRQGLAGLMHPHLYAGGSLLEIGDRRHDQTGHHRGERPDVQGAAEPLRHGVDVFGDVRQDVGETTAVGGESLSGRRQPEWSLTSAVKAVHQNETGFAFEPSEVLGDAGRGQMERTGGGTHSAGDRDRSQDQQPIGRDLHAAKLYAEVSDSYFSLPTNAGMIGHVHLIDLVGFAGAVVVLAAFALTNTRSVRVTPTTLAVMNLGAGALALNGLVHQAWPSTVVNAVWFVIAAIALGRDVVPRLARSRGSASRVSREPGSYPEPALVQLEHAGSR